MPEKTTHAPSTPKSVLTSGKQCPFIKADSPPKRKFLEPIVPGFVYRRALSVVAAEPGIGKSHLMLDVAATASQSIPTLIIVPEATDEFWTDLAIWKDFWGKSTPNLYAYELPINLLGSCESLTEWVEGLGIVFVCLDGWSLCLNGESDADTKVTSTAVDTVQQIIRKTSAGFLVNHHTGWDSTRERGSIRLRQSARVVAMLKREGDHLLLTDRKANRLGFQCRRLEFRSHGDGAVLVKPDGPQGLDGADLQIVNALRLSTVQSAHVQKLHDATSVPKATVYRACARLVAAGYLEEEQVNKSLRYSLTTEGKFAATITPEGYPLDSENEIDPKTGLNWLVSDIYPRENETPPDSHQILTKTDTDSHPSFDHFPEDSHVILTKLS